MLNKNNYRIYWFSNNNNKYVITKNKLLFPKKNKITLKKTQQKKFKGYNEGFFEIF